MNEVHQPRERSVPCFGCGKPTMAVHAVCKECAPTHPRATCARCAPQSIVTESVDLWGDN